ncbi:MAG: ChuX/HutX family heme-like substrate-binding protein [Pseudomonadota bacterium]
MVDAQIDSTAPDEAPGKASGKAPDADLAASYRARKAANPAARTRDIADSLGVAEGALVDARVGTGPGGEAIARLAPQGSGFLDLLRALATAGPVMSLTRNDAAVHELTGTMGAIEGHGSMGQVTGAVDLRLFFAHWHAGYAVSEETRSGLRHSLQVFDATGRAILKLYAVGDTDAALWDAVLARHATGDGRPARFQPAALPQPDRPDADIDVAALRTGWQALEHSHDFHALLRKAGVGREQALRMAGPDLATPADSGLVERVLTAAAERAVPIMCFVGNPGCLQIHTGPVQRIVPMGPWLNVLDPGFNLHLRVDRVASAWVVVKPTRLRGRITSVELFDAQRRLVCQFFGSRPPSEGERTAWRDLVQDSLGESR